MAATTDRASISRTRKKRVADKQGLRGRREDLKKSYALGQAKTHLSEIVDHVHATGEEIVVTRHGKPVVRLVPDRGTGPRPLGFARGRVKFNEGWDKPLAYEELFGE